MVDLNATKAAIRAGYSEATARQQGQRMLTNVDIELAIQKAMDKRSERTKVNADYVLNRLVEIDQLDIADILDEVGGVLPIKEWPESWRKSISGIDIQEVLSGDIAALVRKIKWPDKLKNLELLGKHVAVSAFSDKQDTNVDNQTKMVDVLKELAERLPV